MEEMKNGVISEEALSEIAGGLSIDKTKLKNIMLKVGIPVVSAATLLAATSAGIVAGIAYKKKGKSSTKTKGPDTSKQYTGIGNMRSVPDGAISELFDEDTDYADLNDGKIE